MIAAENYLAAPAIPGDSEVCVLGGGPTSAWCVERALDAGNTVTWSAIGPLNGAFVASGRNDHLARGLIRRIRANGALIATGQLGPAYRSLRFLEHASVHDVDEDPHRKVELTFTPAGQRHIRSTDCRIRSTARVE